MCDSSEVAQYLEKLKKLNLCFWQRLACQDLQKITKVITAMKRDPFDLQEHEMSVKRSLCADIDDIAMIVHTYILIQNNARRHQKLSKVGDINSSGLHLGKVNA